MKSNIKLFISALFVLLIFNCKNEANNNNESNNVEESTERTGQAFLTDDEGTPNCLQIAIGSPDHKTLVAAVQAAQVENALVNVGPLTVFAPTDAAFAEFKILADRKKEVYNRDIEAIVREDVINEEMEYKIKSFITCILLNRSYAV